MQNGRGLTLNSNGSVSISITAISFGAFSFVFRCHEFLHVSAFDGFNMRMSGFFIDAFYFRFAHFAAALFHISFHVGATLNNSIFILADLRGIESTLILITFRLADWPGGGVSFVNFGSLFPICFQSMPSVFECG